MQVTESAKELLKDKLVAHTDDPEIGIRLALRAPGQFGLVPAQKAPDDHVVEYEGLKVLLVGREEAELLQQVTLDTEDTPDGPKLVILKGK